MLKINTWTRFLSMAWLALGINLLSIVIVVWPKAESFAALENGTIYHTSNMLDDLLLTFMGLTLVCIPFVIREFMKDFINTAFIASIAACLLALFGGFYADVYFLFSYAELTRDAASFTTNLTSYLEQHILYYGMLLGLMVGLTAEYYYLFKMRFKPQNKLLELFCVATAIIVPAILLIPLPLMNLQLTEYFRAYYPLPMAVTLLANIGYGGLTLTLWIVAFKIRKKTKEQLTFLVKYTTFIGGLCGFILAFEIFNLMVPYFMLKKMHLILPKNVLYFAGRDLKANALALGILCLLTLVLLGCRKYVKKMQFDDLYQEDNAGTEHGGSKWASHEDIKSYGYYSASKNKFYIGKDKSGQPIYIPLVNRTLLAPPGGGKTTAVITPFGLLYNGPIFVTDFKGELWAVFARHRHEVFKRKQILIDPFNITSVPEFHYKADMTKKPDALLKKYRINPFHSIPEEPALRQRVLSAFASSFIVRDAGGSATTTHFYENAEILIRGLIDYVLKTKPREDQNFKSLLKLSQTPADKLSALIDDMLKKGGESENSAGTISKLGVEERGGVFSTTGRQLAWLTDYNMQDCLGESNFDISEIVTGDADIYVVLPADAAVTHGRLIRMIIALIRGELIRLPPSELPEKKIVFLLDELAQLGRCPDIEQAIEVFRSYGLVVWGAFQFLSQIKKFDKPDVFTGSTALQIFTNNDNDTMEFIQEKFSQTTILQKTLSNNKGDQRQKNQVWGGSVSAGEGESVQSSGVSMVHFNEIREMPKDEQWILVDNCRPIKARKLPYYLDDFFADCRYDPNPIEDRAFAKRAALHGTWMTSGKESKTETETYQVSNPKVVTAVAVDVVSSPTSNEITASEEKEVTQLDVLQDIQPVVKLDANLHTKKLSGDEF